jgi:hypothetical protein
MSPADDVPALASNITERLAFRATGLRMFWDDPHVRTVRLQGEQHSLDM